MPADEIVLEVRQVSDGVKLYCKAKPIFDWLDSISREFVSPGSECTLWERQPIRVLSGAPAPLRNVKWDGWGASRLLDAASGEPTISLAWLRAKPNDDGEITVIIKDPHGRKSLEDFLSRAQKALQKLWNSYCQPYEGRVVISRRDSF
jgi:hypothetical protein